MVAFSQPQLAQEWVYLNYRTPSGRNYEDPMSQSGLRQFYSRRRLRNRGSSKEAEPPRVYPLAPITPVLQCIVGGGSSNGNVDSAATTQNEQQKSQHKLLQQRKIFNYKYNCNGVDYVKKENVRQLSNVHDLHDVVSFLVIRS